MDAFRAGEADVLDLDDRDRGRCRRAQRHGDARGERRAFRARAAPPAARADRARCLTPPPACCSTRPSPTNEEARARIDAMVRTTDGFELADEDLRLRGEGTLFDTKQSGMPDLKLARLAEDVDLVKRARARAFAHARRRPGAGRAPRSCWTSFGVASNGPSTGSSSPDAPRPSLGDDARLGSPIVRIIAGAAQGTRLGPVPAGTRPLSDRPGRVSSRVSGPTCRGRALPGPVRRYRGRRDRGALARRGACTFVERSPRRSRRSDDNLDERASGASRPSGPPMSTVATWTTLRRKASVRPRVLRSAVRRSRTRPGRASSPRSTPGWLAPESWTLVLTRGHKSSTPVVPVHWAVRRQLRYGDSLLTLYREERWA